MMSAATLGGWGLLAVLLLAALPDPGWAQSPAEADAAGESDDSEPTAVDRGKMRLKLLITLVENELEEVTLHQSQLAVEAAGLDQQRRTILAAPLTGSQAETRQLDVIDKRLAEIDEEMAAIHARLPEIHAELLAFRGQLDGSNGVVPERVGAAGGTAGNGASAWLDSKRQVQEALVYLGGYNALIDGDFGPRTREAIRVYQTAQDLEPTGTLTAEQEAALLEQADVLRMRYGLTSIEDEEVGYRLTYPSGLLSRADEIQPAGRRFRTVDGEGELVITTDGAVALTPLFDDLLGQYDVQYRRKQQDWFVVAGLVEEGRIVYDTARTVDGRIIRARLTYPAAWRDLWSPFAVIMFNTFEGLPSSES